MKEREIIELLDNCKEQYWELPEDDVASCLKETFEYLLKSAKIRDDWEFKWSAFGEDISIYAISQKQKHEYALGFFRGEIYLESFIFEPKTIKYMPSEFWAILADLDLKKNFNFQENAWLSKKVDFDTRTGVSSIYKIVRNYILLEEHQPESTCDLGAFEARWGISESSVKILSSATDLLKGLHKLNYLLYRRDYQKRKGAKA
ncbi:hypothetical protein [Neptuniibacter sp. CAU 1671]|uniref:hypothetical protein n=1 Tax=Neptuniibacter sp. CAU 1671 TaxID=3032593 RepID=UPI0023DB8F02|nr:hypothetical protein [Neptuniibacter sp. CAU 1671]MDF2181152.1 hypothetical protein [Neptuniibacter sp. CAU 1671]